MKTMSLPNLSFYDMFCLFTRVSDNELLLDSDVGKGSLQIYKPEKGMQVNILDCSFFSAFELQNHSLPQKEPGFFNLAYFLEPQGIKRVHAPEPLQKLIPWNCAFFSDAADFRLSIAPMTRYRCVIVRFSRQWLLDVLQNNNTLQQLKENINHIERMELFQSMTQDERNTLENMVKSAAQNHFRTFYIKAASLKIVCDFLFTLKPGHPSVSRPLLCDILDKVEHYLCEHITKEFTGTKALAQRFSMSESTLKRHFKKRYGITIAAYLTRKKMQYARELMQEKGITMAEASRMVGYRSVQYFKEALRKHSPCMTELCSTTIESKLNNSTYAA